MSAAVVHEPDLRVGAGGACVFPACSCRWTSDRGYDLEEAREVHAEHVAAFEAIAVPELASGDKFRFDGKATYLTRHMPATTSDRRAA